MYNPNQKWLVSDLMENMRAV